MSLEPDMRVSGTCMQVPGFRYACIPWEQHVCILGDCFIRPQVSSKLSVSFLVPSAHASINLDKIQQHLA